MRLETGWIPMPDGVRLAADFYKPDHDEPCPVLLEYLPYRKTESRGRNWPLYSYFVDHDYIVARVDIRGTGNSEGRVIPHEYSDIEQEDGEVVIAWLADQPWSTGNIGMFGISWGGFNSIQMATRQPPALKAFVAVMATEALYAEDTHHVDGVICTDSWLMSHDLYQSMPGAPDFELDENWLKNRFEAEPSWFTYIHQQRDGPFWDRASSLDKYDRIKAAGFHIGGWYDGYRNSVARMVEHCRGPVKGMLGPWDHYYPHNAWPGPPMEWRREAVRWYDHWLKGIDTGIMDEPAFAVYVRDWHPPDASIESVPGRWRWEESWPPERTDWQSLYADGDSGLVSEPATAALHKHRYQPETGLAGGGPTTWWGSIPPDQQPHDDVSLVYETEALDEDLEILGFPLATLQVASNVERANWYVRLSDVSPDGQVTQVAGAGFNGTHRDSARDPSDLVPGEEFEAQIRMHFTSWVFPKGHRIRLAISNAQWPMFWPTRDPATTTLRLGGENGTRVDLPVIPPGAESAPRFEPPAENPQMEGFRTLQSGNVTGYAGVEQVDRIGDSDEYLAVSTNAWSTRYPWGSEDYDERYENRVSSLNPAISSTTGQYSLVQHLEGRQLRFEHEIAFISDYDDFTLKIDRRVLVDGEIKHEKSWEQVVPRDFQ